MFEQAFRNIDDVLRKEAGCTTELDYTEQTSWLLFLKYPPDFFDFIVIDECHRGGANDEGNWRGIRPAAGHAGGSGRECEGLHQHPL